MLLNSYKFISLVLISAFITGCFSFVKPGSSQYKGSNSYNKVVTHHRVKAGETLYSIAFQYGRDHRELARWNKIRKPYTIFPKQRLRVIPIRGDKAKIQTSNNTRPHKTTAIIKSPVKESSYVSNAKLKWRWPTKGKVVSTFSIRDPGRRGIDIAGRKGQRVNAAAAGRVVYRGNGLRGYGNLIIIKHNETYFSAYAHTESVVVKEKEKVKLGQHIADMGNTSSEKTKLHFEIRRNGKPINPMRSLPKRR